MSSLGTREAASWPAAPIGMTNDRLRSPQASGVAFGVRLTPAGAALRSLASPALAVDRKVEPRRPSQAMERKRHACLGSARRLATVAGASHHVPSVARASRRVTGLVLSCKNDEGKGLIRAVQR